MPRFLVLYRSSIPASEAMANASPEQAKAGMDAWMAWAIRHDDSVVDLGSPTAPGRRLAPDGSSDAVGGISGYSLLEARHADDLEAILRDHPHFRMPGETSIEVLELLPVPGT